MAFTVMIGTSTAAPKRSSVQSNRVVAVESWPPTAARFALRRPGPAARNRWMMAAKVNDSAKELVMAYAHKKGFRPQQDVFGSGVVSKPSPP